VSFSDLLRCPQRAKRIFAVPPALFAPPGHAHLTEFSPAASWNLEPWLVACLLLAAVLYARGAWALWRKAGVGRGLSLAQGCAFIGGWFTLCAALVSPIDALGGSLFAAHMVQHELLMVIAAPLFVSARPLDAPRWNFHKYLVGRDGQLKAAFTSAVEPTDPLVVAAIEKELAGA